MKNPIVLGLIFFVFFFTLSFFPLKIHASGIIYYDNFNGTADTNLEIYNNNYTKYPYSDYLYLTGANSIYTPVYGLEYYSSPYTSTQGLQFDFTTNFLVGLSQQFGIEVFAHSPGNRAEDIYIEVYPDGSARIINIDATHIVNFPVGYFTDNTTYAFFVSYDGNNAVIYLNGTRVDSFNHNYSGFSNGSFAIQLTNYACIGNLYYTDSLTPISSGRPSYLKCPVRTPINKQLDVPLLKQTSNPWQSQIYDSAINWASSSPTINSWGCALTSAAMVFRYYGLNKLPDGTSLDPGTLNTWLKNQNDGYIGSGLVNWLALARLSKLAKSVNGINLFDALEYTRIATSDGSILTADINNKIPDIPEEPGHFIVAKGIAGNTFNINDPYYNRNTLNDGYSNTFLSLGKYIPSSTNLSYIMLAVDPSINIVLKDSIGNLHGEQFVQQPLVNDGNANQKSGSPIKIFYFKKPTSGTYQFFLTSANTQTYDAKIYLYDKNGQVKIANQTGLISPNSSEILTVNFDNLNSYNSGSEKIVKFQTLIDDIKEAKKLNLINSALADGLINLTKDAQRNYSRGLKKASLVELSTFEKILNSTKSKFYGALLSEKAYEILLYDVGYLKNHL